MSLIRKNILSLIVLPLLCAGIGFLIADSLTAKFKSLAVVGIQANYFQNPLINDLVVQVADPVELQSQRMSLLKLALNSDFLDFLANRYEQYKFPVNSREHALERESFALRITYFSSGSTSFQLSVVADDALLAQAMNKDIVAQIRETLVTQRYQTLANVRAAVKSQLADLSNTLQVPVPVSNNELSEEDVIQREMESLLRRFTPAHPRVIELRRQLAAVQSKASRPERVGSNDTSAVPSLSRLPFNRRPLEEVYAELAKKLNYLNVVMGMEQDRSRVDYFSVIDQPSLPLRPFFPNKRMLAMAGGALGAVLMLIWLTFDGARLSREMAVSGLSSALHLPLLGELPPLPPQDVLTIRATT